MPSFYLKAGPRTSLRRDTYNQLPVLLLQGLVALPKLIGHEFVLVPLLLACVQLLGEDQQGFLLTLQLPFAHEVLQNKSKRLVKTSAGLHLTHPAGLVLYFVLLLFFVVFRDRRPRRICQ